MYLFMFTGNLLIYLHKTQNMTPPEHIIDALKHQSAVHRAQLGQRSKYEWNVFLAMLGFFTLAVIARYSVAVPMAGTRKFELLVWWSFFVLALLSNGYLRHLHHANHADKTLAENAEKALREIAMQKPADGIDLSLVTPMRSSWSWRWQSMILMTVAVSAAYLITGSFPYWKN